MPAEANRGILIRRHSFRGDLRPCCLPDSRPFVLIAAVLGMAAVAPAISSSYGADPATADEKRMEAWWVDLEKGDTAATRALLNLSDRPKDTVAFLKNKMKPLTISSGQVKALLLKLGNDNESVWKPAFEELEYFDPRLAIDLQTLMDRYTESPTRQRMVEILSGREAGSLKGKNVQLRKFGGPDDFNFFAQNEGSWWAENRVERINSEYWRNTKKKWTRARPRHRAPGAHRHPRRRGHSQGHGHRPSRRLPDQGGQGSLENRRRSIVTREQRAQPARRADLRFTAYS